MGFFLILEIFGIQHKILGNFGSKCNFGKKSGSKYEYQKVFGQNEILGKIRDQNMNVGNFRLKRKYDKFMDQKPNMTKHGGIMQI